MRRRFGLAFMALCMLAMGLIGRPSLAVTPPPEPERERSVNDGLSDLALWPWNYANMSSEDWLRFGEVAAGRRVALDMIASARLPASAPLLSPVQTNVPVNRDAASEQRFVRVPILMYHYISEVPDPSDRLRQGLSVTPQVFESHLQFFKNNGWTTIHLEDLHAHLATGQPLPPKPVVLTFDDGYLDNYQNAFPLLTRYGAVGTFFVVTDLLENNPNYMSWPQVQAMSRAGMRIENHTRGHVDMRNRDDASIVWQVLGATEAIQVYTGRRPQFFAYPAGRYDANVLRILASAGTLGAVTTEPGVNHNLPNSLTWQRVRITGDMPVDALAQTIGR